MKRKEFLKNAITLGTILSVSQILEFCSSEEKRETQVKTNLSPIVKVIEEGIKAPNAHNTQPWKFKILNDLEALLYVDEKRLLPETDPTTRQIHISQGTFIETLVIAAGSLKYKTDIKLFPEGKYSPTETGKKPVAKIKLVQDETVRAENLSLYIDKRSTIRTDYYGNNLTDADFRSITDIVNPAASSFHFITKEDSGVLADLLIKALEIETNTRAKHEETRLWFRYNDAEIYKYRDGVSLRGNGISGVKYFFAHNFFVSNNSWHDKSNRDAGIAMFKSAVLSSKGFLYLKTKTNTLEDWIGAGRDYTRLHLAVAKLGLAMHPMSQILQEYREMDELKGKFENLLNIKLPEKVQMIVRIGKSGYRFFSPRRDLTDMIV